MTQRVEETRMDPGGLRQGKVRSQEVTTSTLDTPSTSRSISPEKSAQIFTHLSRFCMGPVEVVGFVLTTKTTTTKPCDSCGRGIPSHRANCSDLLNSILSLVGLKGRPCFVCGIENMCGRIRRCSSVTCDALHTVYAMIVMLALHATGPLSTINAF